MVKQEKASSLPQVTSKSKQSNQLKRAIPEVQSSMLPGIIQRLKKEPGTVTRDEVMQLQSTIGNQALIQLLNNKREPQNQEGAGGGFPSGQHLGSSTGLPEKLKMGVESLSGLAMNDVRVQYNSSQPARLQASAYTQGTDIHVAPGQERHLAHEAWHVVQQKQGRVTPTVQMKDLSLNDDAGLEREADVMGSSAASIIPTQRQYDNGSQFPAPVMGPQNALPQSIQRYGSGEHVEFGDTAQAISEIVANGAHVYKVKKGETLEQIAAKFGVTVNELNKFNRGKLTYWKANNNPDRKVVGFNAGETVMIPPHANALAIKAMEGPQLTFVVNGVSIEYGVGIAMGDLFKNPEEMAKQPKEKLEALVALIKKERSGIPVSEAEWQKATDNRYLALAQKNEGHFAPSNPNLAVKATGSGTDQKTLWETYHSAALEKSRQGLKDEAFLQNAFADHFLTDAFAAGHLINKLDVMEKFQKNLPKDKKGEFTKDATKFFDRIAAQTFTGKLKEEFSSYETDDFKGVIFRPNIDSESRFSKLLQGIHQQEPELLANAVAKGIHDTLNEKKPGLEVENARGDRWIICGEGKLNSPDQASQQTKEIARKAVAQSQLNVINMYKATEAGSNPNSLLQKVWDYVPRLTKESEAQVKPIIAEGTNPANEKLINVISDLIKSNYKMILDELVKRKILKKA